MIVTDESSRADLLPISESKRVLLRSVGGGCGREIPAHKYKVELSLNQEKIWCGMESSAMPGLFFTCSECLHGRD